MLKRLLLAAAVLIPQVALAADLAPQRHRHVSRHVRYAVEQNNVIHCTTTKLGLFSYSDCGQVFDPLGIAVN